MYTAEEYDLCLSEIAWELAEVVHLRLFFFPDRKKGFRFWHLSCTVELDQIDKVILSVVGFLPANDPESLT